MGGRGGCPIRVKPWRFQHTAPECNSIQVDHQRQQELTSFVTVSCRLATQRTRWFRDLRHDMSVRCIIIIIRRHRDGFTTCPSVFPTGHATHHFTLMALPWTSCLCKAFFAA